MAAVVTHSQITGPTQACHADFFVGARGSGATQNQNVFQPVVPEIRIRTQFRGQNAVAKPAFEALSEAKHSAVEHEVVSLDLDWLAGRKMSEWSFGWSSRDNAPERMIDAPRRETPKSALAFQDCSIRLHQVATEEIVERSQRLVDDRFRRLLVRLQVVSLRSKGLSEMRQRHLIGSASHSYCGPDLTFRRHTVATAGAAPRAVTSSRRSYPATSRAASTSPLGSVRRSRLGDARPPASDRRQPAGTTMPRPR
jgi:hypothetical protein